MSTFSTPNPILFYQDDIVLNNSNIPRLPSVIVTPPSDSWSNFIAWYGQLTVTQRLLIKANFLSALIVWEDHSWMSVEEKIEKTRERMIEHNVTALPRGFTAVLRQIFLSSKSEMYQVLFCLT